MGDFIRLLRNGIAHGNISFLPDGRGTIAALQIANHDRGKRTWGVVITPETMKQFLVRFTALVEELDQQSHRLPKKIA